MQKYRPKTLAAKISDRILRALITTGVGMAWFIWLWGVTLPALCAGLALGVLIWMLARQYAKHSTRKKEQQLRRMIGGELALKKLLLEPQRHADFQAALWIAPRYPAEIRRTMDWGVEGTLNGSPVLIRVVTQHESMAVSAQQVVEAVRSTRLHGLSCCLLCLTSPACREALSYAASAEPPVRIISRQELIALAGACHPATDEDLRRMARQKQKRRSPQEWLAVILDASRARRYFWYGSALGLLALTTGMNVYPLPAAVCLLLYSGCKIYAAKQHSFTP